MSFSQVFIPAISFRNHCDNQARGIKTTKFFKYLMKSHKDTSCCIFPECIT